MPRGPPDPGRPIYVLRSMRAARWEGEKGPMGQEIEEEFGWDGWEVLAVMGW
jgi:hypothetical protein